MRVGLLSDVHSNLPALRAVLNALEQRGVSRILVAGDIVGYGGQPNECVSELVEAGAECVAGNHDLLVLDRLPPTRFPAVALRSADLTRTAMSSSTRAFLASLPLTMRVEALTMAHGSPSDPEEYVVTESRALELLAEISRTGAGVHTLVLGHTHRQWCVSAGRGALPARGRVQPPKAPLLINPGSVGQSRQRERRPRARFAIYDSSSGEVEFCRIDYDVASSLAALDRLGLSSTCLHAPPVLRDQLSGALRRLLDGF
jgi:predicted phosphodiesterase